MSSSYKSILCNSNNSNTMGLTHPHQRKFPTKLWKLVSWPMVQNEGKPMAITWTRDGEGILIATEEFEAQYLHNKSVFKTGHLSSFIRQLNLYGFKKHGHHRVPLGMRNRNAGLLIYSHPNFKRDAPHLLKFISRKAASAVRIEAKREKTSKKKEISSSSKPQVTSQPKHGVISPNLQNARNNLLEVLEKHLSSLVESYQKNSLPASPLPDDPHADIEHIGAEEIIDDSQEFDLNMIIGPEEPNGYEINVTDLSDWGPTEHDYVTYESVNAVWVNGSGLKHSRKNVKHTVNSRRTKTKKTEKRNAPIRRHSTPRRARISNRKPIANARTSSQDFERKPTALYWCRDEGCYECTAPSLPVLQDLSGHSPSVRFSDAVEVIDYASGDAVDLIDYAGASSSTEQLQACHDMFPEEYPMDEDVARLRESWVDVDDFSDVYPNTHFSFDDSITEPYLIESSSYMTEASTYTSYD